MAGYIGNKPKLGNYTVDEFTTSSAQVSSGNFTLSQTVTDLKTLEVSVGGIDQPQSAYTISGTTLAFGASVVTLGDIVIARHAGESISYPSLETGAVTASTIGTGAVIAAKLGADAIDGTKIADDAINSEHYTDASIDLAHLAADSVDGTKIADNAINSEHYTDGSIDNIHTNFQPGTTFKGDGSSARGKIVLNCEQNTHGVSIQSPAHSAGATYTLTLPTSDGNAAEHLITDGSGVLSWAAPPGDALDATPDTDHTANGPQTSTIAAGYTTTLMDLVYLHSNGRWEEADADATSTSINLLGIALEVKDDGEAMNVALSGSFVRDNSWSWTPGVPLYMHTTLGAITATKPTGSGDVVRTVGYAVAATYIFFAPSSDYVTLA